MLFYAAAASWLGLERVSVPVIEKTENDLFICTGKGGKNGFQLLKGAPADVPAGVIAQVDFQQHDGLGIVCQHAAAPFLCIPGFFFGEGVAVEVVEAAVRKFEYAVALMQRNGVKLDIPFAKSLDGQCENERGCKYAGRSDEEFAG